MATAVRAVQLPFATVVCRLATVVSAAPLANCDTSSVALFVLSPVSVVCGMKLTPVTSHLPTIAANIASGLAVPAAASASVFCTATRRLNPMMLLTIVRSAADAAGKTCVTSRSAAS
jgi:hypothetical protein